MSEVKKEKTSKKKEILKKLRGFLVIVLVAAVSILGTLAYLSRKTDRVTNTFTATDDIKIEIVEPTFTPPVGGYQPGVPYPKDPRLANVTGKDDDKSGEWVIMRVDYRTFSDGDKITTEGDENLGKKLRTYTSVSYDDITYAHPFKTSEGGTITPVPANNENVKPKGLISITQDLNNIATNNNWIKVEPEWLDEDLAKKIFGNNWTRNQSTKVLTKGEDAQKCDYFIYKNTLKASSGTNSDLIATHKPNLNSTDTDKKNAAVDFFDSSKNASITIPLFTQVTIKSQEQLEQNGYKMDKLPGFTIDVIGGAIKNQGDKMVEIANDETGTASLNITNLATPSTNENPNVSRNIVNELVKLLMNEEPVASEYVNAN